MLNNGRYEDGSIPSPADVTVRGRGFCSVENEEVMEITGGPAATSTENSLRIKSMQATLALDHCYYTVQKHMLKSQQCYS